MFSQHPVFRIAIVFVSFFAIVVSLSTVFGYQTMGGYLAPVVLLVITAWLYKREGANLSVVGLTLKKKSLSLLPIGLLFGVVFYAAGMFLIIFYKGFNITLNPAADGVAIALGALFFIQGVLNEELIFRGYCFQQTVARYGATKANLVFALLFLVWHWFSWNPWGNYGLMLSAITVCFGHLLFATSFLRSGTLFFPIGIHLGNNWAVKHFAVYQSVNEPSITDSIFIVTGDAESTAFDNFITVLLSVAWMLAFTWIVWKTTRKEGRVS